MNNDATEAALGLLGLSPLNSHPASQHAQLGHTRAHHHLPHHHHHPVQVFDSAHGAPDPTASQNYQPLPVVPLKRKQPSPSLPSHTTGPSSTASTTESVAPTTLATKSAHIHTLAGPSPPAKSAALPLSTKWSNIQQQSQLNYSPLATSSPLPLPSPIATTTATMSHPPVTSPHPSLLSPSTFQSPTLPPYLTSQQRLSQSDSPLPLQQQPHPAVPQPQPPHPDQPPPPPSDADDISCICGFTYDDGFSIACDVCSRWCHAACFGIVEGGYVPEEWRCWTCGGGKISDEQRERAVKLQRKKIKAMRMKNGTGGAHSGASHTGGAGGGGGGEEQQRKPASRRKTSPGVEKKPRKASAISVTTDGPHVNGAKKRRRASMLASAGPSSAPAVFSGPAPAASPNTTQPQSSSCRISQPATSRVADVFPPDVYPNPSTHARLLKVSRAWRGVTALNPPVPLLPPRTYVDDGGYVRVDSQGYKDRYGYSMSPLDTATPVVLDANVDMALPPTVLKTPPTPADNPSSSSNHTNANHYHPHATQTHTPPHLLRPPEPRLHVGPSTSASGSYTRAPLHPPASHSHSHPHPHSHPHDIAIPSNTLLAPYTASISPSSAYLADPLNGYAHLGMGKPQVRLVGGGWCVGVDARELGGAGTATTMNHHGRKKTSVKPRSGGCEDNKENHRQQKEKGKGVAKEAVVEREEEGAAGAGAGAGAGAAEIGKARWARCGCWPNAVVRPVICGGGRRRKKKGEGGGGDDGHVDGEAVKNHQHQHHTKGGRQHRDGCAESSSRTSVNRDESVDHDDDAEPPPSSASASEDENNSCSNNTDDSDSDSATLSFALFALRDLRADEEIVLGWEWDDGHAVHMLPALIESPGMFGPAYLQHLRAQFTSIIHALSSTFTTCACGSSTRDCAIRVMERVVDGKWPWPASEGGTSGSDRGASAGEEESEIDLETVDSDDGHGSGGAQIHPGLNGDVAGGARSRRKKARQAPSVDLGPLVGVKRGFRTRERMPMSGGWHGVEVVPSSLAWPGIDEDDDKKAVEADVDVDSGVIRGGRGKKKRRNQEKDKRHVVADDVVVDVDGDENDMDVDVVSLNQSAGGSDHVLPPRMRKSWIQQQRPSSSPSNVASVAFADNETSVGPGRELNGGHYDLNGTSGQETEFDTETEGEDMVDDTRQMPPPPMPASLDPTTVSSLAHAHAHIRRCSSPRAISAASKTKNMSESSRVPPRWMPSRTPTPAVASAVPGPVSSPQMQNEPASASVVPQAPQPGRASLSPQEQSLLVPFQLQSHPPRLEIPSNQSGTSPSVSFSKLSLLSADPPPQPSRNEPTVSPSLSPDVPAANQLQSHQGAPCRVSSLPPDDANPLSVHPCPPSSSNEVSTPATMYADSPREVDRRHPPVHTESSPGILDGFPALKTRGDDRMQDHNQECAKDATGDVNGLAGLSPHVSKVEEDADAMDVDADIDVVGDGPDKTGVEPSHDGEPLCVRRASGDNIFSIGPHGVTPIKPDPLSAFLHPQSSISSDLPSSERMPSPAPPEASHSELQPPNTPIPHQTEPEPEPSQPARVPSPPPPPKVKLSLRDFALRRKKQREEEMAAKSMLSPVALTSSALPSSPGRDEKVGEAVVAAGDVNMKDSAEDLKMSTGHAHEQAAPMDGSGVATSGSSPQHHNFLELSSAGSQTVKETDVIAQSLRVSPVPPRSLLSPPRAMHKYESDQTQSKDSPNPGKTLTAKLEIMEDVLPNGDAHSAVNDHTQGVVSLAPDPPPPPSSKAVAETNHVDGGAFASLPPSASTTSSSSSSSRSTSISTSISTHPSLHPSRSQLTPNSITTRRPSHEDGEIPSSTPPKAYVPRSHTPPTQPRSFQTTRPPSPSFSPSSSSVSRRPPAAPPPSVSRSAPGPGPVNSSGLSRPVPSGPRALRGTMNQSSYSTYPSTPARPYSGSQYIPRGPSADRDRMDWDRDRSWSASSRSRGRAGSGGWGR